MKHTISKQSSYATLFDPEVARAVAARAAQWNLPRRECRPLDRYPGRRVAADLAAYDAQVELAPVPEEELMGNAQHDDAGSTGVSDHDADFDDDADDF